MAKIHKIDFMDVHGDEEVKVQTYALGFATCEVEIGGTIVQFYGATPTDKGFSRETKIQVSLASLGVLFRRIADIVDEEASEHLAGIVRG